jgi:hypothetical protein
LDSSQGGSLHGDLSSHARDNKRLATGGFNRLAEGLVVKQVSREPLHRTHRAECGFDLGDECGWPARSEHQWVQLGLDLSDDHHVDTAVINAIARVTGGNFRLVQRLFAQIERIVSINNLPAVSTEVVTLARERLVEGAS